jgi:hypothetical protein
MQARESHTTCSHALLCARCDAVAADMLEETLLALASDDRTSGNDRKFAFEKVRLGVEHFVASLDPSSFYGLVDKVTVAAYILRSAKLTLEQRSPIPLVEAPLHVAHDREHPNAGFMADSGMSMGTSSSGKARAYIERTIFAINCQLLEICRPEAFILRAKMFQPERRAYIKEYFEQDHFSASNVIRTFTAKVC